MKYKDTGSVNETDQTGSPWLNALLSITPPGHDQKPIQTRKRKRKWWEKQCTKFQR